MTEPGNINQLLPKGQDWIPRKLADLERLLRRQAGGVHHAGRIVAYAVFFDSGGTTGVASYRIDGSTVSDSDGDYATYMQSDGYPGVQLLVPGWYAVTANALVDGLADGASVRLVIDSPYSTGSASPSPDGGVAYGVSDSGSVWAEAHAKFLLTPLYTPGVVTATVLVQGGVTGDIGSFNWIRVYKLPD